MSARTSLYARLSGDATLTGLLSGPAAIFYQVAPQTATFPYVILSKSAGTPDWQFAGAHVQTEIWIAKAIDKASSATRAEQIAARIDALLTDQPLTVDGGIALAVYRESDISYVETSGADTFRHDGAQYRLVTEG